MPGRGTPRHAFRIPDELYQAARAKAAARGEDLAAVVRAALERYVKLSDRAPRRKRNGSNGRSS